MMHVKCKYGVTIVSNNFARIKSISTIDMHEISILFVPLSKVFLANIQDSVHSLNNNYFQAYVQIFKPYWKLVI